MKTRTHLFFCVLLSLFVMSAVVPISYTERRPEKVERAEEKQKRREEKRERSAEKKERNEDQKDKDAEQDTKIKELETQAKEEGKIDRLKTWVGAIPLVGGIGEVVVEEVTSKVTPRADCPRCPDKVWKRTDHRQTCYNVGHPSGSYTFYSCENFGRCTNESVHRSRPLDPVLSNYSLCDYCGQKVYDYMSDSHVCSN